MGRDGPLRGRTGGWRVMKVRVVLTLDVDAEEWCGMYGLASRGEVREDVRRYLLEVVRSSTPAQDGVIRDVKQTADGRRGGE